MRTALATLIKELDNGIVLVLIIDGLCFLTTRNTREQEMRKLINGLVSIFRQSKSNATLKYLFSSSMQSRVVEDLFEADAIFNLASNLRSHLSTSTSNIEFLRPQD